jgi:hypothetical protein
MHCTYNKRILHGLAVQIFAPQVMCSISQPHKHMSSIYIATVFVILVRPQNHERSKCKATIIVTTAINF